MDLAFNNHRIDHIAEVVSRSPINHLHNTGGRIDFDLRNMRPGREGEVKRIVESIFSEPRLQIFRIVVRHISRKGNLTNG